MTLPARGTSPTSAPVAASGRLAAIDWLRGLVMVVMTVDHAGVAFDRGHHLTDSAVMYHGEPLNAAEFLTRFATHLCAPTFVFLAGTALALSVSRRTASGEPARVTDRHIVTRGLVIAVLDPLWMSLGFDAWHRIVFQVLYAIGMAFVCMAGLRRLPPWALAAGGIGLIAGIDALVSAALAAPRGGGSGMPPLPIGLLVSGGAYGRFLVAYPLLPWLGIMMLGWAFGALLARRPGWRPESFLVLAGTLSLIAFGVLRGIDRGGNMGLYRVNGSILQWLHVSKYPPSVTFCSLELGLMALLLAGFFALSRTGAGRLFRPLGVLGSTALFFYLLHVHMLVGAAVVLRLHERCGLGATYLAAAVTVTLLYFACRRYAAYKATHRNLVTRYI